MSFLGKCITTSSSYSGWITDDMLCAGQTGKDACQVLYLCLYLYLYLYLKKIDLDLHMDLDWDFYHYQHAL